MTNSGLAMAYIIKRQYADAIPPAETALTFFRELHHAYWMAINETYLAEAWLYLDELEKAEAFAQAALRWEEAIVRPYCLFLLGHMRRQQRQFDEAEQLCRDAIVTGEAMAEPWAQGPAWVALGETLCDAGCKEEARSALEQAISIFTHLGVLHELKFAEAILIKLDG